MTHSVRRHLRVAVEAYDEAIRRFIPGYEAMLEVAAGVVAEVSPAHVLDLGAGTGALSEAMLRREEVGTVELIDVDAEMLEQARVRLFGYGKRARFTLRSYDGELPACQAVAASLALHHVPSIERKARLYGRVFEALGRGGVFVNADATMPDDPVARDATYRAWAEHMVASGIAEERAWRHFEEWAEEDTYFPVDVERAALEDAGFRTEVAWREGPMTVVVGRRGP